MIQLSYHGDGRVPPGKEVVTRVREAGRYLASLELRTAVNTALIIEQPLLVTGEPGTGKTALAYSIATELGLGEVLEFFTRSDSESKDVLYAFDDVLRFADANRNQPVTDLRKYVRYRALGEAIRSDRQRVVLIDEIDKAQRDFPNDLLEPLDKMRFQVDETGERFTAEHRPIVIVTSNSERQLPDAFLRRCVFHHIRFPDPNTLAKIVAERLQALSPASRLLEIAVRRFNEIRNLDGIRKKPATYELISWVRVLIQAGVKVDTLERASMLELFPGTVLKTREDLRLVGAPA